MTDPRRDATRPEKESGAEGIDRRFLDENAEGEQEIVDAAARASEEDRQEPDRAERRERRLGVEDPSHSKGSTRRRS